MNRILIHSARLAGRTSVTSSDPSGWALLQDGALVELGTGERWTRRVSPGTEVVDAGGDLLAPAFVDIHCHGGGGSAFEDADGLDTVRSTHRAHGTGTLVASLVTNPLPALRQAVARLGAATADGRIAGIHLEGPCLSPGQRGAHHPDHLLAPSVAVLEPLLEAGGGAIVQVTLAPEMDAGLAATRFLVENGVKVAVGHTEADYATTRAAFDAGASLLTHTFNAMPGLHHRNPGPVAAALDDGRVVLELIADGVHVHDPLIRLLFTQAPGRVALVTDAMAAAGFGDGTYQLGELAVEVRDSVARLAAGGSIAGSTLTMDAAVRRAVAAGVPLDEAVKAATIVPARALGLGHGAGLLEPGAPAPVLLCPDGSLRRVFARL
ncbi:N-acetylglucosamine-6-phosphate deacetylase [Paeniglutamicibacter sp.]|uniref:N-acetylglucosamine-6-phosphate deacetylase n=1 Tax=Paeniglutamicibacter sp. TaxID=1934391 RepID=UPI003989D6B3